jgi:drug/metabolite transporter (DMT)-like permease
MVEGRGRGLAALALLVNAFVWGVSWWPFRQLHHHGVHPLWATAFIYIVAIVSLLAWRPDAWRAFGRHPRLWLLLAAAGFTNVGFNWGVTIGDVVRVVLLFYLMPAWTVVLAWPMLGERPSPMALLRLAVAMTGVFIVLKAPGEGLPIPQSVPDWLAIAAGFSFALTNIVLRQMREVEAAPRILAMFGGGAVLGTVAGLGGLAAGMVAPIPSPSMDWVGVGLMLSVGFLVSNMALQYGVSRLNAHAAALIMLAEIVFASVSSVAVGAAQMLPRTWIGGSLILLAAAWSAWPVSERRGPPTRIAGAQ